MNRPRISGFPKMNLLLPGVLICLILVSIQAESMAAEFTIRPSIALSEEYSDNINQEQNKRSAFTTRITPSVAATYRAPVWDWDLNYRLGYQYHSQEKKVGANSQKKEEFRHRLNLRGLTRLIDNLFYLRVSNNYERVDLNIVRSAGNLDFPEVPEEDGDLETIESFDSAESEFIETDIRDRESSDRNTFTISPYFRFRPTERTSLGAGYEYVNTWYREDIAEDTEMHRIFADAGYRLTRQWELNAGYSSSWKEYDDQQGQDREYLHNVYGGTTYTFSPGSNIYGRLGTTWREREDQGVENNLFWQTGFQHRFSESTSIFGEIGSTLQQGRDRDMGEELSWNAGIRQLVGRYIATLMTTARYIDDPLRETTRQETAYNARIARPYGRGTVSLVALYSEFDEPDEDKYAAGLTVSHMLTQRLTANAGLFAERRKRTAISEVDEWRTLLGLRYLLMRDLTVSLNYQYTDSSSSIALSDDNFQENRVMLELRKSF